MQKSGSVSVNKRVCEGAFNLLCLCQRYAPFVVFRSQTKQFMRRLDEVSEYHIRRPISFSSFFNQMLIKPIYETSFLFKYRRGSDEQMTEVIDTTEAEVIDLFESTFKDKKAAFIADSRRMTATEITVLQINHTNNTIQICKFGKSTHLFIPNLSPREVRLSIEKKIKNKQKN